jgi:CubicO group peptidase (beta-lactamase class C family)
MKTAFRIPFCFLFVVLLAACQPTPAVLPSATPTPWSLAAYFDARLTRLTEKGEFSGSVLIARDGEILLAKGYGLADRQNDIPNTPQTKFCIASVTKTFTAMAVLMLQNQGRLNVQDPFCRYYPNCPASWEGITIHQLLTHTSGIYDYVALPDYVDFALTPAPTEELIDRFRDLPLDFPPGTSWNYSNSGYILLGEIIERISGLSYGDFLDRNIFSPLGMADTSLGSSPGNVALGYVDRSNEMAAPIHHLGTGADGEIFSTVEDLYRWDQALYTESLVPQALLDQAFTAQPGTITEDGYGYGYGWEIPTTLDFHLIQHTGNIDGFKAYLGRVPEYRITVILLINQHDIRPRPLGDAFIQELFARR